MSDFVRPKFAYNAGSGVVDFSPTYPATQKSGPPTVANLSAIRHDSVTSTGIKQSVWERTDELYELNFETVPESDLASWRAMMSWLLQGAQVTYYPDVTDAATYYDYTLEDMAWAPKWKSWKTYTFKLTLRRWVGTATYYS